MLLDLKTKIIADDNYISLEKILKKFSHERLNYQLAQKNSIIGISEKNGLSVLSKVLYAIQNNMIPALITPDYKKPFILNAFKKIGASQAFINDYNYTLPKVIWKKKNFNIIMHSSGSTGVPEALAIVFSSFIENTKQVSNFLNLNNKDIHLGTFSFCYMSGFYNAFLLPILSGGTPIISEQFSIFKIKKFLNTIQNYNPSIVWTSPYVIKALISLSEIKKNNFSSIKYFVSCTAPLSKELKYEFEKKFDLPVLQSYGLCETLINTIQEINLKHKDSSVGKNISGKDFIKVNNKKTIIISNNCLYKGVIEGVNKLNPKGLKKNSFYTSDLGFFDKNNNLYISGRQNNVINLDGKKYLPEVYEEKIKNLLNIKDCVLYHYKKNNISYIYFFYISSDTIDKKDNAKKLIGKYIPKELFPKKFVKLDKLPQTKNNKIDRNKLINYIS